MLSGTPLENRLDDLHSVVEFVDPHRLGPSFRFFHRHRKLDDDGKLLGYKNLDELRERLRPILLRRTRESVRSSCRRGRRRSCVSRRPSQQKELHDAHMQTVAQIVRKPYLTEMDLLRLRMALLMCRMAANGTFLVDKLAPGWSTKLERLDELFEGISRRARSQGRPVLRVDDDARISSSRSCERRKLGFVRLDGSVPQKQRRSSSRASRSDREDARSSSRRTRGARG